MSKDDKGRVEEMNFENCLIYVKRNWPNDDEETQHKRAESVYAIAKVFFELIIPKVVHENLSFSLN